MQNLLFTLGIYRRFISIEIRAQLQYRVAFWLETTSTFITLSLFFVSIVLIFERFESLGGWTLGEVAFLWGMVEAAFGIMDMIFSGFDPQMFGQRVRNGKFDQLLLRPVSITTQVLGSKFVIRRLGRILQGLAILAFALTLVDVQWTLVKIMYLPCVLLGMVCFFGGLFMIGATITFWTIASIEAMNILTYGGSELIAYPMHIYPGWLRRIFTFIVPAIFLNYTPALFFLDKTDPLGLPGFTLFLGPFVGGGILILALMFWRYGIQHYQSTGS